MAIQAEGEGFEPPVTCATMLFKSTAINHSAIPPGMVIGGSISLKNTFFKAEMPLRDPYRTQKYRTDRLQWYDLGRCIQPEGVFF